MKIAVFTDTYYPETNGVSKTLQRLVNYLKKNGHMVKIIAPDYDNCEPSADSWLVPSNPFFLYPECRVAIPNQKNIDRLMSNFRPDLIHITTPAGIGLSGRKYAVNHGIPLVSSYHTNFNMYLEHYGFVFLEPIYWTFIKWFYRPCQRVFCPSRSTLETLQKNGLQYLSVWSRGVDDVAFNPGYRDEYLREAWGAKDKTVLLYVGRLAKEKNIESLFEVYHSLRDDIKNKIKLVIVGQGPLMEKLRIEAPEGTIFTGILSGLELATAYGSGDIFTFTSSTETFGNVLLEAMASGLPVVAPRAGGVLDNLHEGENGLGYDPGDLSGFAKAITLLVENPQLRQQLAKGATRYAMQKSWDKIFGRLVEEYHEVCLMKSMVG